MKVLLLGVGMQGKAALYDLAKHSGFDEVVAADADLEGLRAFHKQMSFGPKVRCEKLDVTDDANLERLFDEHPNVVLDLLPAAFVERVAQRAVSSKLNLVNTCFVRPKIKELEQKVEQQGTTILPEFGVDPGIDLLLLGDALKKLDEVKEIRSYGAGLPEPAISNCNALRYKITWTMEGVLSAYRREATQIINGKLETIPADKLFSAENIHLVDVDNIGELEAYPNGYATKLAGQAGINADQLDRLGCYTMRWPGHSAFWKPLVDLGFLDDSALLVDGNPVSKKKYLAAALEPAVKLGADERDVVIIRVEVKGHRDGKPVEVINQMIDYRDLDTGLTAMSRTVGYTAAIGAELVASGRVNKKGILSPIKDIPFDFMKTALEKRGIVLTSQEF